MAGKAHLTDSIELVCNGMIQPSLPYGTTLTSSTSVVPVSGIPTQSSRPRFVKRMIRSRQLVFATSSTDRFFTCKTTKVVTILVGPIYYCRLPLEHLERATQQEQATRIRVFSSIGYPTRYPSCYPTQYPRIPEDIPPYDVCHRSALSTAHCRALH